MVATDVRGVGVARVHHFLTEGTCVLDPGVLVMSGLHMAEHVRPIRGGKTADDTDVLAAGAALDRGLDAGLAVVQQIWVNEDSVYSQQARRKNRLIKKQN